MLSIQVEGSGGLNLTPSKEMSCGKYQVRRLSDGFKI
jgi:hypothetical protein